jgi:tRNA(fMet)-specific endonuclease VapC
VKLLDTNVCIAFLNGADPVLRDRFRDTDDDLVTCSVVRGELLYGARRSARVDQNLERLAEFFSLLPSLPFDDAAAEHYGVVRALLVGAGTPIGGNDLLIASIALARGASVVTRNHREFHRVPGLRVETW